MGKQKAKLNVISLGEFMVSSKKESLSKMQKVANELIKEHKEFIKEINDSKKAEKKEILEFDDDYMG